MIKYFLSSTSLSINSNSDTEKVKRTLFGVWGIAIRETQVQGTLNHCSVGGGESVSLYVIYYKVVKILLWGKFFWSSEQVLCGREHVTNRKECMYLTKVSIKQESNNLVCAS